MAFYKSLLSNHKRKPKRSFKDDKDREPSKTYHGLPD